jgi:hypothetical protein
VTPAPKPPRPPAPRSAPLATSLAATKPAKLPERERSGALAGAFKSNVQREEEVSAPIDMSDLSPSDEWYVAINGVPVGPIRIAEVRRKAALGAVTEESLCWQEGLDEWRPLRSFPELAAIVREAFASGRSSFTPPPPEGRASIVPQHPRTSTRPAAPSAVPPRAPMRPAPVASPPPPAARSNVVPITSRLATAEKLAEEPDDLTRPFTGPPITEEPVRTSVVPDPFASPPRVAPPPAGSMLPQPAAAAPHVASATPSMHSGPMATGAPAKKAPPWMAIAMVAAAAAFGITAGLAVFLRPAAAPAPVVIQAPGLPGPGPAATNATPTAPTATSTDSSEPAPSAGGTAPKGGAIALGGPPKATASTAAPAGHGPLDLHSLTGGNVTPTDDPGGGDAPKAPGQCFSEGQVQQVIGLHQVSIRRSCWERNPTQKLTVNVGVSLTIGPDGSPQGVVASGDEPSVAKCIENDVKSWHFPAMGCAQKTSFSFKFVRQ